MTQVTKMNIQSKPLRKRALPAAAALAATLLGLPVSSVMAQSFPQYPLQTGAGDVEPNILFILDDSGSMTENEMTNEDLTTICRRQGNSCGSPSYNISSLAHTSNTVHYNPNVNYGAWIRSDGTPMTDGRTYTSVFQDFNLASGAMMSLADPTTCVDNGGASGSTITVCGGTQTYYTPRDPDQANWTNTYLRNTTNYFRYQIKVINGSPRVIRSRLMTSATVGSVGTISPVSYSHGPMTINGGSDVNYYRNIDAGDVLNVSTAGNGNTRLRVYDPSGDVCDPQANNSNESCAYTATQTETGMYRFRVTRQTNNSSANSSDLVLSISHTPGSGCTASNNSTYAYGECQIIAPTRADESGNANDEAKELVNYATWFSYHRTRMKIAKAGASAAFSDLNENVRVGFRTLHQNGGANFNIPVATNNGIFTGANRTTWYDRLLQAEGRGRTPLRGVLKSAGDYFSDSSASGPYGPAATNQLACRQNFSILTTDGYWNDNTGASDGGAITVGDQDGTSGASIINHTLATTNPNYDAVRYTRSYPYRDTRTTTNYSNTLADVAMQYWKADLRTDLDNIVPTVNDQAAFWQHMVTFGISIGLKGTVDQTSVAQVLEDNGPRIGGNPVAWPNPIDNSGAERIDDLLHAAVNGHGEFIAATSADRFRDALVGVLGQIQSRLASGSNVATNSATFLAGAKMFQATYRTGQWTGDVVARDVTEAGISATELWRATEEIAAAGGDYATRTVLTWSGTAGAAFPTSDQETALTRASGTAQVTGEDNAAYILGDQTNEQSNEGVLRNRTTVLGDIVNSSPFYATDTDTLYVGANDGMLHAFDADTGETLFSYLPAGVNLSLLAGISDPAYTHAFFMDGPITVSGDRVVTDTNYLLGTLGRGGKGVFALNVTTPDNMDTGDVLWDHTATTDNDMGYVIGIPMIVKGNNNELLALVPNGIDSTNGGAHLYIYDVTDGTLIKKISTGVTGGNGLSAPRANDRNADQKVDFVYAGDMLGNVWKFDLSSADPDDWEVDLGGEPLFTATDSDGNPQPITGGLALARDSVADKRFVTFGTGRLVQTGDLTSESVQSLYGIIDDDEPIESRDDLEENTIAAVWTTEAGVNQRAFENFQALPATAKGWVVDLGNPTPGERVIGGAQVSGRAAIISSVIPTAGDGCESGGSGYLNAIDVFTGTSPEATGGGGATTSFFDTDGTGTTDNETVVIDGVTYSTGSVDMGVGLHGDGGLVNNGSAIVVCGSDATCEDEDLGGPGGGAAEPRRTSWRELFEED